MSNLIWIIVTTPTSNMGGSTSDYETVTTGTEAGSTAGSINSGPLSSNVVNKTDPLYTASPDVRHEANILAAST